MHIIVLTLCSAAALARAAAVFAEGRVVTYTGRNGGGFVAETDRDLDRAAGSNALDRDVTFKDGSTRSVDADATRTAQGTADVTRTVTWCNGQSVTQIGSAASTRIEDGRVTTGLWGTPSGSVAANTQVIRGDGVRNRDTTAVFEDGSSRPSTTTATRTGQDSGNVSQTGTGWNNRVRQRQGSLTVQGASHGLSSSRQCFGDRRCGRHSAMGRFRPRLRRAVEGTRGAARSAGAILCCALADPR